MYDINQLDLNVKHHLSSVKWFKIRVIFSSLHAQYLFWNTEILTNLHECDDSTTKSNITIFLHKHRYQYWRSYFWYFDKTINTMRFNQNITFLTCARITEEKEDYRNHLYRFDSQSCYKRPSDISTDLDFIIFVHLNTCLNNLLRAFNKSFNLLRSATESVISHRPDLFHHRHVSFHAALIERFAVNHKARASSAADVQTECVSITHTHLLFVGVCLYFRWQGNRGCL